jgi:CRP-like cAMP-binding protein
MNISTSLVQVPLFAHLNKDELNSLEVAAQKHRYQSGEWIVHHGDVWPYLFLVRDGEITVTKESIEGRSLILETIQKGDLFWGLAFFHDDAPMPAALIASQESELYLWSRDDILPLILRNGHLSWDLARLMIRRMLRASEIVEELAFQPVAGRLAGLILDRYQDAKDDYVARDITLDEMAARVGSTREVVCRYLYRFAAKGAIEINRTEFKISNREYLKAQAGRQ